MMDWTDQHCRVFHRAMTSRALLYTEMVTANAVVHGDQSRLLGYSDIEHPVALQLGGSDPTLLAEAAQIGEAFGYDEINLNVGCPSDRVQNGRFGACLMREPDLVARCVAAMAEVVQVPVTVKCRIGVDNQDSEADLKKFIQIVYNAGCSIFIIHARKAWLKGLNPKENREIPPLDYERVYRLKAEYPDATIILNGGIPNLQEALYHLGYVDGVMLGRAAYQKPFLLREVDRLIFGEKSVPLCSKEIVMSLIPYIKEQLTKGVPLHKMTRHMLGMFQGMPGARAWRQRLSDNTVREKATLDTIHHALEAVTGAACQHAEYDLYH